MHELAIVFRDIVTCKVEDSGQAKIADLGAGTPGCLFVRLQSWDTSKAHEEMALLDGRRVTVTITVEPDIEEWPEK